MAKKKRSKRTVVGSPLTPQLLKDLRAVDEFPRTPKDFDPRGDWVNTYRIWTCHGYRESSNYNVGFVRIERAASKSKEEFMLIVQQQVVQVDGILNVIDARMICLNDQLASPIEWHLSSRFANPDGRAVGELGTEETVLIKGNVMSVKAGGRSFKRKVAGRPSCDWCLFEAVQQLRFDEKSSLAFDILEGLSVLKEGQHLSYRGVYPMKIGGEEARLHRFDQIGEGVLPCEYWLDDNHRLLAAISMHKAYILDERAEKIIRQRTEQLRKSYQRIKSVRRKKS